jgi:3-oxoadipate enol-lactonase
MPEKKINNVPIYYELHGPQEAPVLVLNNGVLMNAATSWVFQTPALSRHYRLLQYDCRGQGQSGHPAGKYSMQQHADDLAALLEALEIPDAHIAGISYGGEVGQAFALQYPQKTRSLILADTVSQVGPDLEMVVASWIDAARTGNGEAFFNATVPWNFSPEFIAANPLLMADAKKRYQDLDFAAVIRLCECFLEVDFTGRLSEIRAPTCILFGQKDILKGRAYAEILKHGIPHAEFHEIGGAGHASCWERPESFNTIVLGFLSKQG